MNKCKQHIAAYYVNKAVFIVTINQHSFNRRNADFLLFGVKFMPGRPPP
jgi:hypothetical protein